MDISLNRIAYEGRFIQADVFPMGIDYDRFSKEYDCESFQKEASEIAENTDGNKLILSIDRLDYSKGIPERIKAFDCFLEKYPQYIEKVRLHLIVAPSRVQVDTYEELRREITEACQRSQREVRHCQMDAYLVLFSDIHAGKPDCVL